MLQLRVVNGEKAGTQWVARRFPVRIGRARDADLRLEEAGIWDWHLEISLQSAQGFTLAVQEGAVASLNHLPVRQASLRNGDLIELGAVQLQFGLSPTRHRSLRLREVLTWIALGLLCLGQVALIYWLPG